MEDTLPWIPPNSPPYFEHPYPIIVATFWSTLDPVWSNRVRSTYAYQRRDWEGHHLPMTMWLICDRRVFVLPQLASRPSHSRSTIWAPRFTMKGLRLASECRWLKVNASRALGRSGQIRQQQQPPDQSPPGRMVITTKARGQRDHGKAQGIVWAKAKIYRAKATQRSQCTWWVPRNSQAHPLPPDSPSLALVAVTLIPTAVLH